ncbi:MAG: PAS domain-containing protein [Ginsengibacter sp.]
MSTGPDVFNPQLKEANIDFKLAFEQMPGCSALLAVDAPHFTILATTDDYLRPSNKNRKDTIGKSLFEAFPASPDDKDFTGKNNLTASFLTVISEKKIHQLPVQRYDMPTSNGIFAENYWQVTNKPVLDSQGNVKYIIHTAEDITEKIKAGQIELKFKDMEQAQNLLMQLPVAIHIIEGPQHIIKLANSRSMTLWGKEKNVLGKSLDEVLPELQEQGISGILDEVMETGKPYEAYETAVNFIRHGKKEELYLNIVFQPYYVQDDDKARGVLVSALEVTENVVTKLKLQQKEAGLVESEQRFQNLIRESPVGMVVLTGEELTVQILNEAYGKLIDRPVKDLLHKPLFDVIPEAEPYFRSLIDEVIHTGESVYLYGHPYFVTHNGEKKEGFLNVIYQPYKEANGTIAGIVALCQDVTDQINNRKKIEESETKFRNLIEQAPVATCVFVGEDMIIEVANKLMLDFWGKDQEALGKPLKEAVPELNGQPFLDILKNVFITGEIYQAVEEPADLMINGVTSTYYFDYTYKPLKNTAGEIYAVMNMAMNVTDRVNNSKKLKESEQQVLSLVKSAPFPIAVYIGREKRIQIANQAIMDVWGKGNDVVGKLYTDVLPELDNQDIFNQVDDVYTTGLPFHAVNQRIDIVVDNRLRSFYFNYSFTPLFDSLGKVYGVMNTAAEVTELALAKQHIEESESNLRNMILQAPVAMCILTGKDFVVDIANDRMLELWGKPAEDIMFKPLFEGLSEVKGVGFEELLKHVYETGETFKAYGRPTILPRRGSTETVYINFVYEAYRESNGAIAGVMAVASDVTEQVLAKNKIEENAKEFRELADSLPEMVWTTDKKGVQLFASKRWKEFTGLDPQDSASFQQIVHPDDWDNIIQTWSDSLASGKIYKTEVRIKNKLGKYYWFYVNGEPIRDEQGNIDKWIGAFTNVNEQKKYEENLKLTSERFKLLADAMPQFVWTGDAKGNLNYFNKAVYDYSGLTAEEIEKNGWLQIVHPEERDENVRLWLEAISSGKDFVFEHRFRRADGDYRWQLSRAVPQRDIKGNIKMWVGTSTDIQEIKEQSDEKDYFIGMVSHELKTPITSITGYIQLLQYKYGKGEDSFLNNALNIVNKQVTKTTKLISELLDVSKIKSGSLSLNKENFVLTNLISEVIDEVKNINPGYKIDFLNNANNASVCADRDRIGQVLTNLLINAVKYSPEIKQVEVRSFFEDNNLSVSITDYGIGIKKTDQNKIFERFYRVEGKNEKRFPGFGIGLFVASEIVHRHDGKIGVKSEHGKGSTFYFSLPEVAAC